MLLERCLMICMSSLRTHLYFSLPLRPTPTVTKVVRATGVFSASWSSQVTNRRLFSPFGAEFGLMWLLSCHELLDPRSGIVSPKKIEAFVISSSLGRHYVFALRPFISVALRIKFVNDFLDNVSTDLRYSDLYLISPQCDFELGQQDTLRTWLRVLHKRPSSTGACPPSMDLVS